MRRKITWPWRRRERREAEAARRHRRGVEWQHAMFELTRHTGGRLDLGVMTREDGWQIPAESLEILHRAGTFDA